MITYRPMILEDSQAVARLYASCFSQPWTLAGVQEMFAVEGYLSLVAEEAGEIIGYVGMKCVLDEADITNVAVSPERRQGGIAHQLLRQLLEEANKAEIQSIFLEVRASNLPAITLYGHAGFVECGKRKNYYQEPLEDALVMVWNAQ